MKAKTMLLVVLAVLLELIAGSSASAQALLAEDLKFLPGKSWKMLARGLEYRVVQVIRPPSDSPVRMKIFRIDPGYYSPRVVYCKDLHLPPSDVRSLAEKSKASIMINGGFFDEQYRPLGILVIDGKIRQRPYHGTFRNSGVFLMRGSSPEIVLGSDFSYQEVTQALSCSPRLLMGGEFTSGVRDLKEISRRAGVALDRSGRVLLFVTDSLIDGLSFDELRRVLKAPSLKVRDALCLDGGGSAQLYVRTRTFQDFVQGFEQVPVGLGFFPVKSHQ